MENQIIIFNKILIDTANLFIFYYCGNRMLKQKGQSKKKRPSANTIKSIRIPLYDQPSNYLMKFTDMFFSPKSSTASIKFKQATKVTKSTNVTPACKSRKSSKENLFKTAFGSKKSSEVSTPFEYEIEQSQFKARSNYKFLHQIGSGGFGRVWKVEDKKTGTIFAMKQMSKAKVISKKSVSSIMNQKVLLDELSNPFIINSRYTFQDRQNLYLVMQYLRGGDLRYHMCFYEEFNENQTKFIVACIVSSLQYIHSKNIIHRDLKPENIVFEENGYARITDFGVARKKKQDNSQQTSGTPGYMSPEVIRRMNHSFQADFFALGVIVFEIIFGTRPYMGQNRKQIRQKIVTYQAKIHEKDLPYNWNPTCADFVNQLLKRNKQSRLGYNGIQEIKSHPWLKSINWKKLSKKQIAPPFIPGVICQTKEYRMQMENSCPSEPNQQALMLLRTPQVQKLFKNYESSNYSSSKATSSKPQLKMYRR